MIELQFGRSEIGFAALKRYQRRLHFLDLLKDFLARNAICSVLYVDTWLCLLTASTLSLNPALLDHTKHLSVY